MSIRYGLACRDSRVYSSGMTQTSTAATALTTEDTRATEAHLTTKDGCDTICGIDLVVVPDEFPDGVLIADNARRATCSECKR